MSKIKIAALFGKSASGKSSLKNEMIKRNDWHNIINCTTRPPRQGEKNGVDYYFISKSTFVEKICSYEMIEAACFNDWLYGTLYESLNKDKINIGCFSQESIEILSEDNRLDVYPILVSTIDKERLMRALAREDNPDCEEICRRFLSDKKDFEYIDFDYFEVKNDNPFSISAPLLLTKYINGQE